MNMSFSSLCKYLGASTATARQAIIRQQKEPLEGPMLSYVAAEQRIVSHLVDRIPLSSDVDQSHCKEAIELFRTHKWPLNKFTFTRPNTRQEKMSIGNVEISLKPSLIVHDSEGTLGACKLFFNKPPSEEKPQLEDSVARRMASLLFYYGKEFQGQSAYVAQLCSVWCVRDGEIIQSTGRTSRLLNDVKAACREIELIWPAV